MLQTVSAAAAPQFTKTLSLLVLCVWLFTSTMTGCSCLIKKEPGGRLEIGNGGIEKSNDSESNGSAGSSTQTGGETAEDESPDKEAAVVDAEKETSSDTTDPVESEKGDTDSDNGEAAGDIELEATTKPDVTAQTPEESAELAGRLLNEAETQADNGETEPAYEKALKALDLTYKHAQSNSECKKLSERAKTLSERIGKNLKQDTPGVDVPIKIK